jgi:hypothetical protein
MSFIDGPRGYGNRTVVDDAFTAAGLDRTITLEVADVDLQWRLHAAALATRPPSAAATALLSLIGNVSVA